MDSICKNCNSRNLDTCIVAASCDSPIRFVKCLDCQLEETATLESQSKGTVEFSHDSFLESSPANTVEHSHCDLASCCRDVININDLSISAVENSNDCLPIMIEDDSPEARPKPEKRLRMLKSSQSISVFPTFETNDLNDRVPSQDKENILDSSEMGQGVRLQPDVDSEKMREDLGKFEEIFLKQPCSNCYNRKMERVLGIRHLFHCKRCENVVGLDDSMNYFELLGFLEQRDYQVRACGCGNTDPNLFIFESADAGDENNLMVKVTCTMCKNRCNISDVSIETDTDMKGKRDNKTSEAIENGSSGRTRIKNLSELKKGDHIAFHRPWGFWHHALVIEVVSEHELNVIHYTSVGRSSSGLSSVCTKGVVKEEWIRVDARNDQLYRHNYRPGRCYPDDVTIENARKRLGECSYNIVTKNCEHFVNECKTGNHQSQQSSTFLRTIGEYAARVVKSTMIRSFSTNSVSDGGSAASQKLVFGRKVVNIAISDTGAVGENMGNALTSAAANEGKQLIAAPAKLVGLALGVGIEVISACRDIDKARKQRASGTMSREEFIKVTIKRTCEAGGSITAMTIILPLPHAWIGMPVAALVGRGVGAILGRGLGAAWEKKQSCE